MIARDVAIREQCRSALGAGSYLVETAVDVEQGLQLLQPNRYDLAILEMSPAGFNGDDLIARVRQQDAEIACVVIATKEAIRQEQAEWGDCEAIGLPIREDELLRAVGRALEHRCLALEVKRLKDIEAKTRQLAEERARLEELDRAKAAFIRLVTHELQAPVSAVIAYLDLLIQGYLPPADQQEILKKARDRAREQLEMIADLIELGRIKEIAPSASPEPVQVEAVLAKVIEQFAMQAEGKHLQLSTDVAPRLDAVCMPAGQVKSIWTNLLSNAIKYTPPGGKILVVLRQEGNYLLGQVIDTGIGIPEYAMGNIFSEFYRAPNVKTLNIPGTGLGLAIVRQIIQKAGGNIWVESVEGKGSTFSFTLPVVRRS